MITQDNVDTIEQNESHEQKDDYYERFYEH